MNLKISFRTIFFAFFGLLTTALITSCDPKNESNPLQSLRFQLDTLRLISGTTTEVLPKTEPGNFPLTSLSWTSSDSSVATLTSNWMVAAKKPGKATITVTNEEGTISGKAVVLVSAPEFSTDQLKFNDVGIGADGSVFVTSRTEVSVTGGYSVLKWTGSKWSKMRECAGVRIAVSPNGIPWVVNKSNKIFRYNPSTDLWTEMPGRGTDIGIGADGTVYTLGDVEVSVTGGFAINKWNASNNSWTTIPECAGVRIAVAPNGNPWVVNKSHIVFQYVPGNPYWTQWFTNGNDIAFDNSGSAYIISNTSAGSAGNFSILKLTSGGALSTLSGSGTNIGAGPAGVRWWTDSTYGIHN